MGPVSTGVLLCRCFHIVPPGCRPHATCVFESAVQVGCEITVILCGRAHGLGMRPWVVQQLRRHEALALYSQGRVEGSAEAVLVTLTVGYTM